MPSLRQVFRQLSRQLSVMFVVAATVAISIVSVPVGAQDSTPSATCDASFGTDAATVIQTVSTVVNGTSPQASDFAAIGVDLAQVRIEYEDLTAPAGCEAARMAIARVAGFDEDVIGLNMLNKMDAKNTAYADFVRNKWTPRYDAFTVSLASTETAPAATGASDVCTDKAYQAQILSDFKLIHPTDMITTADLGAGFLGVLNLRYKYEDASAPAGCEMAKADMVKVLSSGEDAYLVTLAVQADSAHSATYQDFITSSVDTRGAKLNNMLLVELGLPAAMPAATS